MKLFRHFLMLCLLGASVVKSFAVDRITAVITITNAPSNGYTLTVNGNVRTWTNAVATPASQILLTNSVGYATTNLFNQIAQNPYTGPLALSYTNTNSIRLTAVSGNPLIVTVSTNWAVVYMSTQLVTTLRDVRVPVSGEPDATVRTNMMSDLVQGIGDYSTTAFAAAANALSNHVNRTTSQDISGAKNFTGANNYSNSAQLFSGGNVTNLTSLSASNAIFAGGNLTINTNGEITYATNFIVKYTNGNSAIGIDQSGTIVFSDPNQNVFFAYSPVNASLAFYDTNGSLRIYYDATQTFINDASALSAFFIGTNYIRIDSEVLDAPGLVPTSGSHILNRGLSDARYLARAGTNVLDGALSFQRKNNTSIAAGNNAALDLSTNLFIKLSGTASAFTINGAAGGWDGRWVILQNTNGNIMTIANNSGVDPTAANRILTGTGADITVTNNPGFVELLYDSEAARWGVKSKSN